MRETARFQVMREYPVSRFRLFLTFRRFTDVRNARPRGCPRGRSRWPERHSTQTGVRPPESITHDESILAFGTEPEGQITQAADELAVSTHRFRGRTRYLYPRMDRERSLVLNVPGFSCDTVDVDHGKRENR